MSRRPDPALRVVSLLAQKKAMEVSRKISLVAITLNYFALICIYGFEIMSGGKLKVILLIGVFAVLYIGTAVGFTLAGSAYDEKATSMKEKYPEAKQAHKEFLLAESKARRRVSFPRCGKS